MKRYRTTSFVQLKISSMLRSFCWKRPGHLTTLIRLLSARLCNHFDFRGQVLKWFESYLHNRKQFVMIDVVKYDFKDLQFGVPQRSVLGKILYLLYISPLGNIVRHHGLSFTCTPRAPNFTLLLGPLQPSNSHL